MFVINWGQLKIEINGWRPSLSKISRTLPNSSNHLPNSSKSRTTQKKFICPIYEDLIDEKKQDSTYCDGQCATWYNRRCCGLSKVSLEQLGGTNSNFYCLCCTLAIQQQEIRSVSAVIADLSSELKALKKNQNWQSYLVTNEDHSI